MRVVLRSRPDVVRRWSNRRVDEHWLRPFPQRCHKDGSPKTPADAELRMITSNKSRLADLRDWEIWERDTQEVALGMDGKGTPKKYPGEVVDGKGTP